MKRKVTNDVEKRKVKSDEIYSNIRWRRKIPRLDQHNSVEWVRRSNWIHVPLYLLRSVSRASLHVQSRKSAKINNISKWYDNFQN